MPRFVAKPLRSTRALRSGRQLSSTSTASDSNNLTAAASTAGSGFNSIRNSFLSGHFPPFDLNAVRVLLATRSSSAIIDRTSTAHSFGAELAVGDTTAQGGTTTRAPLSTSVSTSLESNATADRTTTSSSGASSAPTRYEFSVVTTEHLVNVFGYESDKIIDLTPSSSSTDSLSSLASSTESKSSKVNTFGAAFASRLRKMGASARNLVKLSSSASSIDSLKEMKNAKVEVVSIDSGSSLLFDSDEESAAVGEAHPAQMKALDYACEVLFDYSDELAELAEESTSLDALFGGEDDDELSFLDSPRSASLTPSLDAFNLHFFSAASDASSGTISNHDNDDDTPLSRVKFNNILQHTATKAEGRTGFVCGSMEAGKKIGWELRDHSAGVCGVIEAGAGVSKSREAKKARRGRVWFC